MEVILGHPYSGALYGYFSDQIGGEWSHTKRATSHSYYRTLYGKNYEAYVELALTFLLLYDKVWLTPADNYMPKSRIDPDNQSFIPELGLHADWKDFHPNGRSDNNRYIEHYLQNTQLQQLMISTLRLPQNCWSMIIESAVYEAGLSARKRCPLLCSPGRRALINKLIEIDRPALHPIMPALHEVSFIESYRSLIGMALSPKSLDDLMDAKPDPTVRAYGKSFLEIALSESESSNPISEIRIAELIRESIERERIGKLFAGSLKWVGSFFRLVQSPLGSVGAGVGALVANHISNEAGWYEFSGSIDNAIDKAQFLRRVNSVISNKEDA